MAFNPTKTRTWKDGRTPADGTQALGSLFNAEFDQLYENWNEFFNPAGTIFNIDTISEKTSGTGVTIDGVKLKDSEVYTDTINEKTSGTGVTIDGTKIKDGVLTDDGSDGVGIEDVNSNIVRIKIINIGDWNMDTTTSVSVAHGLSDFKKIRAINVIIRNDNDTGYWNLNSFSVASAETLLKQMYLDNTNVIMTRDADGLFDNVNYDSTSYNRGWILLMYTD